MKPVFLFASLALLCSCSSPTPREEEEPTLSDFCETYECTSEAFAPPQFYAECEREYNECCTQQEPLLDDVELVTYSDAPLSLPSKKQKTTFSSELPSIPKEKRTDFASLDYVPSDLEGLYRSYQLITESDKEEKKEKHPMSITPEPKIHEEHEAESNFFIDKEDSPFTIQDPNRYSRQAGQRESISDIVTEVLVGVTNDINKYLYDLQICNSTAFCPPNRHKIYLSFRSMETCEPREARQMLVQVVEHFFRRLEDRISISPRLGNFDIRNLYVTIDYDSFMVTKYDRQYVGQTILEDGISHFYAADASVEANKDQWHRMIEPYRKSLIATAAEDKAGMKRTRRGRGVTKQVENSKILSIITEPEEFLE